jgi:transcriptional regulator with XRE-family HTH domain
LKASASKLISVQRKEQQLSQEKLAKLIEMTQTEISLLELGKRNARKKTITQICSALKINEKDFLNKHCLKHDTQTLTENLTTTLSEFLGYFEGDGNFEEERITLSDKDKQIAEHYSNLAKKIFNAEYTIKHREKKGYFEARIYGKQIVSFIKKNFPEINKALTSTIPTKVMQSNNVIVAHFLKGLFDAEGYLSNKEIGLGINNFELAQQIQLCLMRLGIQSSLLKYDNKKNKYTKNMRYTIIVSNKYSIQLFQTKIGFNSTKKSILLQKTINKKSEKNNGRQILAEGTHIKQLLIETNNPLKLFYNTNMFLNGKRKISKEIFKEQIINKANENARKELNKIYEYNLLPTEINHIQKTHPQPMIDISVQNENFLANGLIVHNSSQRFERLREEAMQDFFKKSAEKFNSYFEPHLPRIKGVLIGGPGMTKNYFMEKKVMHHELEKKVLGVIDTSYTDEGGIRELVQKSQDLLKDSELIKERQIIDKFLGEVAKNGLATYGQKEVEQTIEERRLATLIISEDIPWVVFKKFCEHCNIEEIEIAKDPDTFRESDMRCTKCQSRVETIEEISYLDYMIEKAKEVGAQVRVISTETNEGKQFYEGFGGIAALLRYKG